jgi:hypothetical protein
VILDWINRELPPRLAELHEPLSQPDDILKVNVGIDHPVRHQQRVFETFCEVNGRRLAVGQSIVLGKVQDV